MYKIEFSETGEKQFFKLPPKNQKRILNVLERIKIRPYHFIKRKEGSDNFILRFGEYRAILEINNELKIIYVIDASHRKNIYKK